MRIVACAVLLLAARPIAAAELAYLAFSEGYWQVWVRSDEDGSRQVTRSPGDKTRCSWFPDGQSLLVNTAEGTLLRVRVADGAESVIAVGMVGMLDAVMSPDGRWIAFSLQPAAEGPPSGDGNDVWVARTDGTSVRRLGRIHGLQAEPAWSPDSTWVYYFSADGAEDLNIWRSAIEGEKREQLTVNGRFHLDVAVRGDGGLAYSSNRAGTYDLWIQRPGHAPDQLTNWPEAETRPTWSPDGRELVFESSRGGTSNLWRISEDGGDAVRLTEHRIGARSPAWFRGGRP